MTRALLAALLLATLCVSAGGARAQGADAEARVELDFADGVWNGLSSASVPPGAAEVLVWVPADARVQEVSAEGGSVARWSAAGADALRVRVEENATRVTVAFDAPAPPMGALAYRAPAELTSLVMLVRPAEGRVPQAPGQAEFVRADDGRYRADVGALAAGDTVAIRVVDANRVGELPVLLTIGAMSLVVLGLALAWHRVRPPLGGREPTRFLDHLTELQARLLPPAIAFGVLNVLFFIAGLRAITVRGVPLVAPSWGTDASLAARAFEAFAENLVPPGVSLIVLRPVDAIFAQVQMTLFLAFVAVLPLLLYELASFIGPALRPRERRLAMGVTPLVAGLFLVGGLIGYRLMAPLMIRTLYAYAGPLGAAPFLVVGDLVSFTLVIVVAFGLAFELPVLMYVLARLGLVRAASFRKYLRHAVVAIFLLAGIVTPDPSVVSQALIGLPVTLLYLAGIATAGLGEARRDAAARGAPAGAA